MSKVNDVLTLAKKEGRKVLTEFESKELLASLGVKVPKQELISEKAGIDVVVKSCQNIGYPIVMKLIAEDPETRRWWKETDPCQIQLPTRRLGANWSEMEMVFLME